MRIAIIQPYFFPYAGYFRLINQTDLFVVFDCVQFPRRGWVHRNRIINEQNQYRWLTLPLEKQERLTTIRSLKFHPDAMQEWHKRVTAVQPFMNYKSNLTLYEFLVSLKETPMHELMQSLQLVCKQLMLPINFIRSSELAIDPKLKGQQRVIEICRLLNAKKYLNAPGGRHLYQKEVFEACGITLEFLTEYQGSYQSILQRLFNESVVKILDELNSAENRSIVSA